MTKHELDYGWTLDDVMEAHDVLDTFHDLDVLTSNRQLLEQRHRAGGKGRG